MSRERSGSTARSPATTTPWPRRGSSRAGRLRPSTACAGPSRSTPVSSTRATTWATCCATSSVAPTRRRPIGAPWTMTPITWTPSTIWACCSWRTTASRRRKDSCAGPATSTPPIPGCFGTWPAAWNSATDSTTPTRSSVSFWRRHPTTWRRTSSRPVWSAAAATWRAPPGGFKRCSPGRRTTASGSTPISTWAWSSTASSGRPRRSGPSSGPTTCRRR